MTAANRSTVKTPIHLLCEAESLLYWLKEYTGCGHLVESELIPGRLLVVEVLETIDMVPMEAWNEFHAGEIQPHVELDRLKIACDHLLAGLEKKPSRIDTDDVAAVATVAERIKRLIRDSDDRMTAKEIAALLPISVSTLRNKGLLRPFVADQSNGGRPTTYHYVQARPALEKHFGESLPDLLSAHRVISHRL